MSRPVHITGIAVASGLGGTVGEHLDAIAAGSPGLRRLSGFPEPLPAGSAHLDLLAGWISDRTTWFRGRRYGAASNAAVRAARIAAEDAGWSRDDLADAWVFAGSSRANAGELLGAWNSRRPFAQFRASNSLHSEVAAAVSIELGIRGPWQMLANGCSAGLDALGMAWMALRSGSARRALVIGVELPLIPALLDGFTASGLLAPPESVRDPYHHETGGFIAGEGVAALALESTGITCGPEIVWYGANSDAYDSIALPPDGGALARLLEAAKESIEKGKLGVIRAVCPHANGTASNRCSESAALRAAFPAQTLSAHLLKPFTGHSLGASGALETAILCAAMRRGGLPANLPGTTPPAANIATPDHFLPMREGDILLNLAIGMGGHNAVLAVRQHKPA